MQASSRGGMVTVNLELGRPTVKEASRRLVYAIRKARQQDLKAIKIIHGYGSSGVGGRLRIELRRLLKEWKEAGNITNYIPGEEWSVYRSETQSVLVDCPECIGDADLFRKNKGITIVVL